jgi:hypothetical protein
MTGTLTVPFFIGIPRAALRRQEPLPDGMTAKLMLRQFRCVSCQVFYQGIVCADTIFHAKP